MSAVPDITPEFTMSSKFEKGWKAQETE